MANYFKKLFLFVFLILFGASYLKADPYVYLSEDSLISFIKISNKNQQQKKLVNYIKIRFQNGPEASISQGKLEVYRELDKFQVNDREALKYFIESTIQRRYSNLGGAETAMVKAINQASKDKADFLTYSFISHLAFIQTDKGNAIGAIYSYGLAQKEALKLNDPQLQVVLNINISDLYYKLNLYDQSLFYLDQAFAVKEQNKIKDDRFYTVISYNKAENFFRMGLVDSLKLCHDRLLGRENKSYKLFTYQGRTGYYISLLKHRYPDAISQIKVLKSNKLYVPNDIDDQNLADAFYKNSQPDSAKAIVDQLIVRPYAVNHPEIKYHLYELLGKIARDKADYEVAAVNFDLALKQSEERINNTTQVGNISAQIKIDKIESSFTDTAERYRRERLILILIIAAVVFMLAGIVLLYRSIRQKRHYEKLLYDTKKQELAFINSHEVRKHLTNILGIVELMNESKDKKQEFMEVEKHLYSSATKLDDAIRNISEKLSD
jgi:hypothetical protein